MHKIFMVRMVLCFTCILLLSSCTKLDVTSDMDYPSPTPNSGCKKASEIHITAENPEKPYNVLTHLKLTEYIESGSARQKRTEENLFRVIRKEAAKYCGDAVIEIRFSSAEDTLRNKTAKKKLYIFSKGHTQKYIISGKVIKWITP